MDYDIEENRIYVVDVGKKAIMRMYMNGSNVEEVIKPTMVRQPEGITVDWIGRQVRGTIIQVNQALINESVDKFNETSDIGV